MLMRSMARAETRLGRSSPGFQVAVAAACATILSLGLAGTIALSEDRLQWAIFLSGVLFAATLSLASQVSKSAWRLARREQQIKRLRAIADAATQAVTSEHQRAVEAQARAAALFDASEVPILHVDENLACTEYNRAAAEVLGLRPDLVRSQSLRALLGELTYEAMASCFERTLDGKATSCRFSVRGGSGRRVLFDARQLPIRTANGSHFYMVLHAVDSPLCSDQHFQGAVANRADTHKHEKQSAEFLYVQGIANEFMPGDAGRRKVLRALHENEFMLFTQKIACLSAALPETECYEVLLRLKEEEDHMLPPGGFIPVAEHYGLMGEIDRWVVGTLVSACLAHRALLPNGRMPMFSVNLSRAAIADPKFALFVRAQLARPEFAARALCFEIDELDLVECHADVRNFVAAVRSKGCRIAIDGFGGNTTSFCKLGSVPVDFLKLDAKLIQNMLVSPSELAKVKAIRSVCERLGIQPVALFVESDEVARALAEIGIHYLQGFGIARPGPIEAVFAGELRCA